MIIQSNEDLLREFNSGTNFDFLYFWGHTSSKKGVGKNCLSQWYKSSFKEGLNVFNTAEQYMMYRKSIIFNDLDTAQDILNSNCPKEAKKLGRKVKGYNENVWASLRYDIVVQGNFLKFSQNLDLKEFLLSTGGNILVEASPVDCIWGVGMYMDDTRISDFRMWKGSNLLGYALMKARYLILNDDNF